jgi:hypothetical protein
VVATLRGRGVLDTTYLIVTSDHGWHQGEHRLPLGKETPYEESIRVPLGVIGPGVAAGRIADDLALNIDLAPTVADLAGAEVPPFVDGRSLTPILHGETLESPRRCFLVEHASAGRTRAYPGLGEMPVVPTYQAVRCRDDQGDILYVEYVTGECELYDWAPTRSSSTTELSAPPSICCSGARSASLVSGTAPPRVAERSKMSR